MQSLTRKKVQAFQQKYGFEGNLDKQFEYYVASIYLFDYLKDDVARIETSVMGGGQDEGIDIALVTVNGQAVFEPSDIDALVEGGEGGVNSAKVFFIQAKTSEGYDSKLISKFLHGVELVTKEGMEPGSQKLSRSLSDTALLLDALATKMDSFESTRIPCELIYQTTASHDGESAAKETQVVAALDRIRNLGVYQEDLKLTNAGNERLATKQKERQGPRKVKFNFSKRVTIPDDQVEGVEEAYIGLLTAQDVLNLLLNEGEIRPGIFDENVRLDLGAKNPVNREIAATLRSPNRGEFPFLNNGLTLVASQLDNNGDRFFASGYQFINGGQTSNQIIRWSRSEQVISDPSLLEQVWVPVKIISANDAAVRRKAAVATNLQSAIGDVEIQSTLPKAKEVEEYFAQSGPDGLRFERQTGEQQIKFTRTRVFKTSDLDRAVAAVVFGDASTAAGSSKELERKDSYIWGDFPVEIYYYAAFVMYRVDRYLARTAEVSGLTVAKYHLGMLTSAFAVPELLTVFEAEDPTANWSKILKPSRFDDLHVSGELYREIESAIPKAVRIVSAQFDEILSTGRSLRKDDIRSLAVQRALVSVARSEISM